MKKLFLYAFLVLGILFLLYNYSFSIKTYLKCEPYNQDSKEILYFAFDKKTIWSNYDPINSKFRNASKATYGERYVTATWDNITINRESGTITITPSLTTSTILLMVDLGNLWRSSTSQSKFQAQLLRGSTSIRVLTTTTGHLDLANEISSSYSGSHIDSPSTTSATTYKIQGKVNVTGTFTVNYTGGIQSITAFEIGA